MIAISKNKRTQLVYLSNPFEGVGGTGGGADGGCPTAPGLVILEPDTRVENNVPEVMADGLEPNSFTDPMVSKVLSDELKPVIILSEES